MSLENAFETGRLYGPLKTIADANRDIHSAFALLPALHGFWPMSASDASGDAIDQSGNSQMMSYNGGVYNLANVPYIEFDGATDYLAHTDIGLYDITGTESYIDASIRGLTVGGWFYANVTPSPGCGLITKSNIASQRSYSLVLGSDNSVQMITSGNGSSYPLAQSAAAITLNQWFFAVGRFSPSAEINVYLNGVKSTNTSAPAALFNCSTAIEIGRWGLNNARILNGRAALCFLCAAALPDGVLDNLYQVSRKLFGV